MWILKCGWTWEYDVNKNLLLHSIWFLVVVFTSSSVLFSAQIISSTALRLKKRFFQILFITALCLLAPSDLWSRRRRATDTRPCRVVPRTRPPHPSCARRTLPCVDDCASRRRRRARLVVFTSSSVFFSAQIIIIIHSYRIIKFSFYHLQALGSRAASPPLYRAFILVLVWI